MTDQPISPNSGADEAGAAAAAAAAAEAAKDGGGAPAPKPADGPKPSWLDGLNLPEDVRGHAAIGKYAANPESMARALIHLEGHMGVPAEQLVRLPKPDDAEGNAALWNRLGRPETPDKYEVKVAEGSDLDKAGLDSFLAHLHKAGPLTPAMAQAAGDWYDGWAKQQAQEADKALATARTATETALKQELGAAYEPTIDASAEAIERFGAEGYEQYLKDTNQGSDPRSIKTWAAVAKAMGEPGAPDPGGKGGRREAGVLTPAEAEAELVKYSTPDTPEYKAIMDQNDGNHDHHLTRRNELFRMKRGG